MKDIVTTTIYSEKLLRRFLSDFYFEKLKYLRIFVNILIIVVIINFIVDRELTVLNITALIISLFGIIEINSSMIPRLNYYKLVKKKDSVLNTKIKYTFKKNNIQINLNKSEYIDYKDLKKVIENNEAYYLYVNNSRAFIVDKEPLSDPEKESLTSIFKEKTPTYKYKK